MTKSHKRKRVKNTAQHNPKGKPSRKVNHIARVFILYFVVFGSILAFIGYMGDDSLPEEWWFTWLLLAVAVLITTIATVTHFNSGQKTKIDTLADKW